MFCETKAVWHVLAQKVSAVSIELLHLFITFALE